MHGRKKLIGLMLAVVITLSNSTFAFASAEIEEKGEAQQIQFGSVIDTSEGNYITVEGINNFESNIAVRRDSISQATLNLIMGVSGVGANGYTVSTQVASVIGIENMEVQVKNGLFWTTIASGSSYFTNTRSYSNGTPFYSAVKGKEYRVKGTHFAVMNGIRHEIHNSTSPIVYTY